MPIKNKDFAAVVVRIANELVSDLEKLNAYDMLFYYIYI